MNYFYDMNAFGKDDLAGLTTPYMQHESPAYSVQS